MLESQSHCLIVVVKAMDHAQQAVLEPMAAIRQAHPNWPLLVVQTTLHEGYPTAESRHSCPTPTSRFPARRGAARFGTLAGRQREYFAGHRARFVAGRFHPAGGRLRAGVLRAGRPSGRRSRRRCRWACGRCCRSARSRSATSTFGRPIRTSSRTRWPRARSPACRCR